MNKETIDYEEVNKCFDGGATQFICGLDKGNDVFLKQIQLTNCAEDKHCLQYIDENTQILSVTTDDQNNKYCNFINQFNSDDKIENPANCLSTTPHYTSDCNDFNLCKQNPDTNNCPFEPRTGWNCIYDEKGKYVEKGDDPDVSFCVVQDGNY